MTINIAGHKTKRIRYQSILVISLGILYASFVPIKELKKHIHAQDEDKSDKIVNSSVIQDEINIEMPIWMNDLLAQGTVDKNKEVPGSGSSDEDTDDDDWEDDDDNKPKQTFKGFIELENYISTDIYQEPIDIFKKNELRVFFDYKFGTETIFFKAEMNLYANLYGIDNRLNNQYLYSNSEFEYARNLRLSGKFYEVTFNKLFFNFSHDWFRMRIGNQVYAWGTADVFNPTAYFNPFDLRELLFKDEDELKHGVPSFSSLFTIKSHSIEIVVAPIHVPSTMAESGNIFTIDYFVAPPYVLPLNAPDQINFWSINYQVGPFPVYVSEPKPLDIKLQNIAAGIKYYFNVLETDINLSYYHGPDSEPVMRPTKTVTVPYKPVYMHVEPRYYNLHKAGIAISRTVWKFALQFEATYSPNKKGVVAQYNTRNIFLPFLIKDCHYLAYSAGFNFFIPIEKLIKKHDGEFVFTAEWNQSVYFDKSVMGPMLSDMLVMRLQDGFFNNRLEVSFTSILDVKYLNYIIWPQIQYKFDMGLSINVSYMYIDGKIESSSAMYERIETGSFLGYYKNNDIISLRIRYEY